MSHTESYRSNNPLTFERWLRSLEASPRLLDCEAGTPQKRERYKSALRQWKQAGYPHPGGDGLDTSGRELRVFTEQWVDVQLEQSGYDKQTT